MEWPRLAFLAPLAVGGTVIVLTRWLEAAAAVWHRSRVLETIGPASSEAHLLALARGEEATLEGVLRSSARIFTYHPHGTAFLHEVNPYAATQAPEALRLELAGGIVAELDGPVQVLVGSIESEHDAAVGAGAKLGADVDLLGRGLRGNKIRGQLRILDDGVRARIAGRVERAPGDGEGYREVGRSLRITPRLGQHPGAGTIPLVAVGRTRRRALRVRGLDAVVVLVAMIVSLVTGIAMPHAPEPLAPPAPDARARAFAAWSSGDFREASDAFARAASEAPGVRPSLTEIQAHLFAHDRVRAATATRALLERFYPGPGLDTAEQRYLGCIAERIARKEHALCGHSALARYVTDLEEGANRPFGVDEDGSVVDIALPVFPVVVAPLARPLGHPVGLERLVVDDMLVRPSARGPFGKLVDFHDDNKGDHLVRLGAMAADLALFYTGAGMPERAEEYWPIIDRIASTLEAGKTYGVVYDESSLTVQQREDRVYGQLIIMRAVMTTATVAARLMGNAERADRYARHGDAFAIGVLRLDDPIDRVWPAHAEILKAAQSRDGGLVVRILEAQGLKGADALVRMLPRITNDRAAIATWLRSSGNAKPCMTCGASQMEVELAQRLAIARAIGAPDVENLTVGPLRRFVDALGDREIAWDIAELETFFARPR